MGFSLFGPYHIGWLIVTVLTTVFVSNYFKKLDAKRRTIFQRRIAWFILLFEIVKNLYLIIHDEFSVAYLPFALCGLAIFAIFYHAYTNNAVAGEMLFNLFLPGAAAGLLFCNWTHRSIFEFMCFFSFIFHMALVVYCVMVLYAGIVKPDKKRIKSSVVFLACAGVIIYPLNKIWGTNFMFLSTPSPGSPLVPLENLLGNPGYIVGLAGLILLVWFVIYLPWKKLLLINRMGIAKNPGKEELIK